MRFKKLKEDARDDLFFEGPFWIIAKSMEDINKGNFTILSQKYLVDFDGNRDIPKQPAECTHKYIWNSLYKQQYNGVEFDYYPRGRVVSREGKFNLNIPSGLPDDLIKTAVAKEFNIKNGFANVFYKDPTTGGHYSFSLGKQKETEKTDKN